MKKFDLLKNIVDQEFRKAISNKQNNNKSKSLSNIVDQEFRKVISNKQGNSTYALSQAMTDALDLWIKSEEDVPESKEIQSIHCRFKNQFIIHSFEIMRKYVFSR